MITDKSYKILPDTYTELYGRYVSHNSYNSPIEVNSFKWDNKVSVAIGNGGTVEDGGDNFEDPGYHYNAKWKQLISLHNQMRFESPARRGDVWPSGTTSAGNQIENLWWGTGDSGMGIQFDEVFIYINGRHGTSGVSLVNVSPLFEYGGNRSGNSVDFDSFGVVVCKRG